MCDGNHSFILLAATLASFASLDPRLWQEHLKRKQSAVADVFKGLQPTVARKVWFLPLQEHEVNALMVADGETKR